MENPSSSSREGRDPPKLKRELRIPVLKIQKLEPSPPPPEISSDLNYDNFKNKDGTSPELFSELAAPPQLEPVLLKPAEFSNREVESLELKTPLILSRRERRFSNFSEIEQKSSNPVEKKDKSSTQEKQMKRRSNEPVRKIIQSIFAKPKPQKPRRSRRGKGKSTPKKAKASTGHGSAVLKIKIESASSRRLRKAVEELAGAGGEKADEFDVDIKIEEDFENQEKSEVGESECGDKEGSISDEQAKKDSVGIKGEPDEEGDASKKSEDDDDLFDEMEVEDWKPVRAAMVAAMELVAKKQVTEDMRMERRVRKPNFKPLPPKGRGRRTIFKKTRKPVPSCLETEGPSVISSMYFNGNYYQKGDIVYLLTSEFLELDSSDESDGEIEPEAQNLFQVRGFLRSGMFETCASVLHLKPKPDRSTESPFPFDPTMFSPDYSRGETMVRMEQLKIVLHCPIDLYGGHDLTYDTLAPGSIYARLGTSFYSCQTTYHPPTVVPLDDGKKEVAALTTIDLESTNTNQNDLK